MTEAETRPEATSAPSEQGRPARVLRNGGCMHSVPACDVCRGLAAPEPETPPPEPAPAPDAPGQAAVESMQPLARFLELYRRSVVIVDEPSPEDEDAALGDCEACGNGRYVKLGNLGPDDPGFGKNAVPCPKCKAPALRRQRLGQVIEDLDDEMRGYTWEACRSVNGRSTAQSWRDHPDPERCFLYLHGEPSVGKTALAALLYMDLALDAGPSVFIRVSDLIDKLRWANKPDATIDAETVMGDLVHADLLVLDDLGTQRATAFAHEQLLNLIDKRATRKRRTIITSNLAPREVGAASLEMRRVSERIIQRAVVVRVLGPNLREP